MNAAPLPADVRRFLLAAIPTVPHLEALLLLREHRAGWTLAQLASRLYVDAPTARGLGQDLITAGLVETRDQTYFYAPADGAAATIDALATLYARQMVAIAELIHSSSDRKAQRFSDAFRLRKES